MNWLITIVLAFVMAYAILCLAINASTKSSRNTPYWVLLVASAAILYVTWFHPLHITFS